MQDLRLENLSQNFSRLDVQRMVLLFFGYCVTAYLGLKMDAVYGFATFVWPPSGLALAAMLLWNPRIWPAVTLAAFAINVMVGAPIPAAIGISIGNTLEPLLGCLVLQKLLKFRKSFDRLKDVVGFIFVAVLLSPVISATIGVLSLRMFNMIPNDSVWMSWVSWWIGDGLGNMVIASLILVWVARLSSWDRLEVTLANIIELTALFLLSTFFCVRVFSQQHDGLYEENLTQVYVLFPFITWAALRFGQIGSSTTTFGIAIVAIFCTSRGYGPFGGDTGFENLYFLASFLSTLAGTGTMIAATTMERAQLSRQVIVQNRELAQSHDQLDVILKGITDGITVLDEHGQYVYANKMGAQMCGFESVEEFLATPANEIMSRFEILDEEGRPFPIEMLPGRRALRGEDDIPEVIVRFSFKKTGHEQWSIIKASPVFDETRKVRLSVSIFKNFTERKRIEDSLKYLDEANRVLASSLDYELTLDQIAKLAVPKMADWCSIDIREPGKITPRTITVQHADPAKAGLVEYYAKKYPPDWSSDRGSAQVFRSGKSEYYREITEQMIRQVTSSEEHFRLVMQLGFKSALIVPLRSRGFTYGVISLFSAESGRLYSPDDLKFAEELARRCGVAVDNALLFAEVQDQRNQYQLAHIKLEKLAAAAETANQVKSLFLANMSHEIRTPLGAILGFIDLLNDSGLTPLDRKKYTEIIARNGQQLTQLIDDILDLSKVEAGHLEIENLDMSLPTLLSDVSTLMNQRATDKGLSFTLVRDSNLPETICSDPTRLRQILMNIIGNAVKFTSSGGITVKVSAETSGTNGNQKLIFTVDDTGLGISPENRKRLFEWFTQADASTTRKFGGTGLGLALSRRLARSLGGDISLVDKPEQGSRFIISIANRLSEKQKHELPGATKDNAAHSLAGVRVLVVDDAIDNRILMESLLTRNAVIVDLAENGREAIEKAMNGNHDIVLMDIQMPVCDGLEATMELRGRGYKKPIIALTAHAMREERDKTLAAGCESHLTKPIHLQKLLQVISDYTQPKAKVASGNGTAKGVKPLSS